MAKKKITFTEDQIKLIRALRFDKINPVLWLEAKVDTKNVTIQHIENTTGNRYRIPITAKYNITADFLMNIIQVYHENPEYSIVKKLLDSFGCEIVRKDMVVTDDSKAKKDIDENNDQFNQLLETVFNLSLVLHSDTELERGVYGIRTDSLYGGTYLYEDMALILGKTDHVVKGSEEDPMGAVYDEDTMNYFKELDTFITTNLKDIFAILIQFCTEGIRPGITYWCYDYAGIWNKEENNTEEKK